MRVLKRKINLEGCIRGRVEARTMCRVKDYAGTEI